MTQRANASSQANLFQNQIRELPVVLPPVDLQHQFATKVERINAAIALYRGAREQLDAASACLQANEFRGPYA